MAQISMQHKADLAHHVRQGIAWLDQSAAGTNTSALSYAALELRFAIERLAVHYWCALLNRPIEEHDLRDIQSFRRIESRIYELAGHERKIEKHFEFMRIFLATLKVERPLHTPQIGRLSNYWHECSEMCHIGWPLASSLTEVGAAAFAKLSEIAELLKLHVDSLGWPVLQEEGLKQLRARFIAGDASSDDVLAYMRKVGVWAKETFPDGRPSRFIGEAVPLDSSARVLRCVVCRWAQLARTCSDVCLRHNLLATMVLSGGHKTKSRCESPRDQGPVIEHVDGGFETENRGALRQRLREPWRAAVRNTRTGNRW